MFEFNSNEGEHGGGKGPRSHIGSQFLITMEIYVKTRRRARLKVIKDALFEQVDQ